MFSGLKILKASEINLVSFQIQYHIEMILKSFDSLKKIPEAISEMLMFRKQYYFEQFLPALLRKP